MAAYKKDDDGTNRSPVFDADAAVANQTYTQNVEITAFTLPQDTGGTLGVAVTVDDSVPAVDTTKARTWKLYSGRWSGRHRMTGGSGIAVGDVRPTLPNEG